MPTDAVVFVRHSRARRYILRVLPDGTLRVTLPRWGAKRDAKAFIDASRAWIEAQRARHSERAPGQQSWRDGTHVLVDGVLTPLRVEITPSGYRVQMNGKIVADRLLHVRQIRSAVEASLRARAARELPRQLMALAAAHDIPVQRVSVRDQRSRWGACSPSGTITLNWRLVQTPPYVREYVLLHELMHRRELNHSRRFWRLVSACCPRFAEARTWLKEEGKSLWPDAD